MTLICTGCEKGHVQTVSGGTNEWENRLLDRTGYEDTTTVCETSEWRGSTQCCQAQVKLVQFCPLIA